MSKNIEICQTVSKHLSFQCFYTFGVRASAYRMPLGDLGVVKNVIPGYSPPPWLSIDFPCCIGWLRSIWWEEKGIQSKRLCKWSVGWVSAPTVAPPSASVRSTSYTAICWVAGWRGHRVRQSWMEILLLSLSSCMTLGKSVNVSKTWVLLLFNEDYNYVIGLGRGLNKICEKTSTVLRHGR